MKRNGVAILTKFYWLVWKICNCHYSTDIRSFSDHRSLSSETFNLSYPDPRRREKINLNFYFHTSLWCLKRFYKGLHKTFWDTTKIVKIKIYVNFYLNATFWKCTEREGLTWNSKCNSFLASCHMRVFEWTFNWFQSLVVQ